MQKLPALKRVTTLVRASREDLACPGGADAMKQLASGLKQLITPAQRRDPPKDSPQSKRRHAFERGQFLHGFADPATVLPPVKIILIQILQARLGWGIELPERKPSAPCPAGNETRQPRRPALLSAAHC